MTVVSIRASTPRPSIGDLVARAGEIRAFVREQAEQTEADRQVSAEATERMREAGLFRIMTPAIYGGYEYGFDALVPVCAGGGGMRLIRLGVQPRHRPPVAGRDDAQGGAGRILVRAGRDRGRLLSAGRQGVAVDGGYRMSGNWGFTSGCDHTQWLFLGGMIAAGQRRRAAEARVLPAAAQRRHIRRQLVHDGARRYRQQDHGRADVFVPAHRVVLIADLLAGTTPARRVHDNPLYRQSMLSSLPFALVAPVLGMAEGALADSSRWRRSAPRAALSPAATTAWRNSPRSKAAWPKRPVRSKRRG